MVGIEKNEIIDFRIVLGRYLRFWYLFLISAILCLALAFAYLWYVRPTFEAKAVLLIKDEKKGLSAGNDIMKELELFGGNKLVENEIEVLKSRGLMEKVVDDLNLTVAYFKPQTYNRAIQLFKNLPISISVLSFKKDTINEPFTVEAKDNKFFT
jgi:uncharacterized protein involved in exopolysaccharide biosynthesis